MGTVVSCRYSTDGYSATPTTGSVPPINITRRVIGHDIVTVIMSGPITLLVIFIGGTGPVVGVALYPLVEYRQNTADYTHMSGTLL